jgi:hypothetical protein
MIKPYCVVCLTPFGPYSREIRYEHDGNFCHKCNLRADRVIRGVITREEADREIEKIVRKSREGKRLRDTLATTTQSVVRHP